jgi:hypothetical protein
MVDLIEELQTASGVTATGKQKSMSNRRFCPKNIYHYVYRITRTDNGKHYIGVHSASVPFEYDHGYWGSGTFTHYINIENFSIIQGVNKKFFL